MIKPHTREDRFFSGPQQLPRQGEDSPATRPVLARSILGVVLLYSVGHLYFYIDLYAWPVHPSDFLGSFPNHIIADWLGDPERYYLYFTMDTHPMPQPYWNYGPVFHLITFPMYFMPSAVFAYRLLLAEFGLAYLVGSGLILYTLRLLDLRSYPSIFAILVCLNFNPAYEGFAQRSVELFEVLLVAIGIYCYSRSSYRLTGIAIGLATMTKFLPGVLILWFLIRRKWSALISSLIVCAVCTIAAEIAFGWRNSWTWRLINDIEQYAPNYFLGHPLNQAISGAIYRLSPHIGLSYYADAIVGIVGGLCIVLLALWLYRRRKSSDWLLEWCLLLMLVIYIAPHNQTYYLVILVIPFYVAIDRTRSMPERRRPQMWAALGVSYLLVGWPLPLIAVTWVANNVFQAGWQHIGTRLLSLSVPLVGSVCLLGVLMAVSKGHGSPSAEVERPLSSLG